MAAHLQGILDFRLVIFVSWCFRGVLHLINKTNWLMRWSWFGRNSARLDWKLMNDISTSSGEIMKELIWKLRSLRFCSVNIKLILKMNKCVIYPENNSTLRKIAEALYIKSEQVFETNSSSISLFILILTEQNVDSQLAY